MKKTCLECGDPFSGRSDAKFCSDHCRATNYNKSNVGDVYIRKVNSILRRNRRILLEFNPQGKSRVRESDLLAKGFNFNYSTNIYNTKAGKTYNFCYDQGYINTNDGYITLVTRHDYVH